MTIIDNYTREELEQIVKQSLSLAEVLRKLGYSTVNGRNGDTLKQRLEKYGIDYSHFTFQSPTKRNEDNIFIENSTASQSTLRRWYTKGNYTPYVCSLCGLEPFWQGKELTLILDHINGINKDDRIENLSWVCPNCNQQLETTGFHSIRTKQVEQIKENKKYYCKECGKEVTRNSDLCQECAAKKRRVVDRPTRDELKNIIRYQSFLSIARQYGVSDKSIVKWCVSYGLPSRKKDINNFTDEEWEKL